MYLAQYLTFVFRCSMCFKVNYLDQFHDLGRFSDVYTSLCTIVGQHQAVGTSTADRDFLAAALEFHVDWREMFRR